MPTTKYISPFFIAVVFIGCFSQPAAKEITFTPLEKLRQSIAQKFEDSSFTNAHYGVLIKSLKSNEVMYARNEKKMFMPGSNMKILTSAAALLALSPDYRFYTRLVTTGYIKEGRLYGDVVLIGSGDPTISGRYNQGRVTETFEQWADSLKLLGIKEIKGRLIGDDNCFDEEYYGTGWAADYETDYYAAQISGVSFNDNCVDFIVIPSAKVGDACSVTWIPVTKYINVINETLTTSAIDSINDITFFRERGTNTIHVRGNLSQVKTETESVTIDNPTLYTLTVLKEVFETKGITVSGNPVDVDDLTDSLNYDTALHLASFTSLPYSDLIKIINKKSQNFYTEQIFRSIGKEKLGIGSFDSSRIIVLPILAEMGVDTATLRMVDGSGLSRKDLVTPADVVNVLHRMYKEKKFPLYYESLPIAGVDGALKGRMKGSRAEGNVHAKTGFTDYVRSLSGYVNSADGEMFAFSIIVNHYTIPTKLVDKIHDDICTLIAEFNRAKKSQQNSINY